MANEWLRNYYSPEEFAAWSPCCPVAQGANYAIVRLTTPGPQGGYGYVLVKKNGRHNVSQEQSLFEGLPTKADTDAMKLALANAERLLTGAS